MTTALGTYGTDSLQVFPQADSPCLARLNERPWGRILAVRVGGLVVGIRARDDATARTLDDYLAGIRIPEFDSSVNPNFSVDLAKSASEFRRLALVYRDHDVVARRRQEDELLADILDLLSDIPRLLETNALAISGTAVITRNGKVSLLPGRLFKKLLVARERLSADGYEFINSQLHLLDPATGQIILKSNDPGIAELQRSSPQPGQHVDGIELDRWGIPAMGDDVNQLRPAEMIYGSTSSILNRSLIGTRTTLEMLRHMSARVQGWTFPTHVSAARAHSNLIRMQTG